MSPDFKTNNLSAALASKRVIVCLGGGGVGKTSISAAIGTYYAQKGKKVLVMTIDPAKRLADSLNLERLDNVEMLVPVEKFISAGMEPPRGQLYAMMLNIKHTWDELIKTHATSPEQGENIRQNHLYQRLSTALAGSQEYMAMEKLYQVHSRDDYDLVVVDTPPTSNALDFLDTPNRMIDLLENNFVRLMAMPYLHSAKWGYKIFHFGTNYAIKTLSRFTGVETLNALAQFMGEFKGMYEGFKFRAYKVKELLRSKDTAFLLVCTPHKMVVQEALFLSRKLLENDLPFTGVVLNRVHQMDLYHTWTRTRTKTKTKARDQELEQDFITFFKDKIPAELNLENCFYKLLKVFKKYLALASLDRENIAYLQSKIKPEDFYYAEAPIFETDVHNLSGLKKINNYLFSQETS